jgi:hypothetical protein
MTALEKIERPGEVARAEPDTIMEVIARAASDPSTDVDKLERLLNMYERITARTAHAAYIDALTKVQQELPIITERGGIKNRDGSVQSKYALWEDINEVIKPILGKHGFALSFRTGTEGGFITVTGVLSHRDGHSEETTIPLPADTSGSKNAVQAVGSSTSYGKRYTAIALLNITSQGEDDDGKKGGGGLVSEDQAKEIRDLIEKAGSNAKDFCAYYKIQAVPDLPAAKFQHAKDTLNLKISKKAAGNAAR